MCSLLEVGQHKHKEGGEEDIQALKNSSSPNGKAWVIMSLCIGNVLPQCIDREWIGRVHFHAISQRLLQCLLLLINFNSYGWASGSGQMIEVFIIEDD